MSIYKRIHQLQHEKTESMRLILMDMKTKEDYDLIVGALNQQQGIKSIAPYNNRNILYITYHPSMFNFSQVNSLINALGYGLHVNKTQVHQPDINKRRG